MTMLITFYDDKLNQVYSTVVHDVSRLKMEDLFAKMHGKNCMKRCISKVKYHTDHNGDITDVNYFDEVSWMKRYVRIEKYEET